MNMFGKFLSSILPLSLAPASTPEKLPEIIYVGMNEDKISMVDFQPIKDLGINNISLSYFDFSGKIPDSAEVNWNNSLDRLWDKKLQIKNVSPATKNAANDILSDFASSDSETMTINSHIKNLDITLNEVKRDFNWEGLCKRYDLTESQCYNLVYVAYNIDANMLTAYSMTELMPYREGDRNYALMSIYMENAGVRYLDAIPALGDTYLSMGRYQFTSFAIGYDDEGPRPANMVAKFSPNYPIPGSVVKLNGIESDLAAYYFSVYNVMSLLKKMTPNGNARFKNNCINKKDQLVEYIATAHHNPSWARKRAIEWIGEDCKKPLINYQGERLEVYSIKTSTNYNAILANMS
jgi:hypothetical protein